MCHFFQGEIIRKAETVLGCLSTCCTKNNKHTFALSCSHCLDLFYKLLCLQNTVSPSHPDLHHFHPSLHAASTIHIPHGRGRWISPPALGLATQGNTNDWQLIHGCRKGWVCRWKPTLNTVNSPALHTAGVWASGRYPVVSPQPH